MPRPYYTIIESDINRMIMRPFGKPVMVSSFLGRVLPGDVGKRVYNVDGVIQVENNEQRDRRLNKIQSSEGE